MAAERLPDHLIEAGRKLVIALDKAGLYPQGAAWIYHHGFGDWKFYVATTLIESMGRTAVYKRLLKIMGKLDMPEELTPADIHLDSLDSPIFRSIGSVFKVDGGPVIVDNCMINGAKFDAVIYRWMGRPTPNETKRIEREFKKRTKELSG